MFFPKKYGDPLKTALMRVQSFPGEMSNGTRRPWEIPAKRANHEKFCPSVCATLFLVKHRRVFASSSRGEGKTRLKKCPLERFVAQFFEKRRHRCQTHRPILHPQSCWPGLVHRLAARWPPAGHRQGAAAQGAGRVDGPARRP